MLKDDPSFSHIYLRCGRTDMRLGIDKMKRNIEKAGVKKIRVHDLRHSHVAYLIHEGVTPLVIKDRLGHKDIQITLNTYGHLYPNEQKNLASMLNGKK